MESGNRPSPRAHRPAAARDPAADAITVPGILVRGHGVASGRAPASPYPAGSIALQIPHFRERGLDLDGCFPATLNVDLRPLRLEMTAPAHVFRAVRWTPVHGPEDFSFAHVVVRFEGGSWPGWVYHPHPETKPLHFQAPSVVEIITGRIPGIHEGAAVELVLDRREVAIRPHPPPP